jgi:hypothetical protein
MCMFERGPRYVCCIDFFQVAGRVGEAGERVVSRMRWSRRAPGSKVGQFLPLALAVQEPRRRVAVECKLVWKNSADAFGTHRLCYLLLFVLHVSFHLSVLCLYKRSRTPLWNLGECVAKLALQ